VAFAILLSIAAPQVHSSMLRIYGSDSRGLVVTTSAFRNSETQTRQQRDENKRRLSCSLGSTAFKVAQESCGAA
jgi:hypothetical protein